MVLTLSSLLSSPHFSTERHTEQEINNFFLSPEQCQHATATQLSEINLELSEINLEGIIKERVT